MTTERAAHAERTSKRSRKTLRPRELRVSNRLRALRFLVRRTERSRLVNAQNRKPTATRYVRPPATAPAALKLKGNGYALIPVRLKFVTVLPVAVPNAA